MAKSKQKSEGRVSKSLKILNKKEKKVAKMFYGLNGRECLSEEEICDKLKLSSIEIQKILTTIDYKLTSEGLYLDFYDNEKNEVNDYYQVETVDYQTQKLVEKMSSAFFAFFPNINPVIAEERLSLLPRKNKDIVFLYYGLDGIHCLDYDEIAEKYNMTIDEVADIIDDSIERVKSNLKKQIHMNVKTGLKRNDYIKLINTYGDKNVSDLLELLDLDIQNMIKDYYSTENPLSASKLSEQYGLSSANIYNLIVQNLNKLENILIDREENSTKVFSDRISNASYEEISYAIKMLNHVSDLDVFFMYYGINNQPKTIKQISELKNKNELEILEIIDKLSNKIQKKLAIMKRNSSNNQNMLSIYKNKLTPRQIEFYNIFEGCSKNQVDSVLQKLDQKKLEILDLYYGLSGEKLKVSEIASKYNYSSGNISVNVKRTIEIIFNQLGIKTIENPQNNPKHKNVISLEKNFYDLFSGHSKDEVDKAIKKLDDLSQGILNTYYLDAERLNQVQIAKKYGVTAVNVSRKIKYSIQTINKILNGEVVNTVDQGDRKSLLYKQFKGYSEKSVNKAILNLKSREREILMSYYLNENETLTQRQIAEKYHLSTAGVSLTIKKSIQKIKDELLNGSSISENSIEEIINEFYSQFDGYSRKEVDEALLQIDKRNADILISYYGLKGEKLNSKEIAQKWNFSTNNIGQYLKKAINSVHYQLSLPTTLLAQKEMFYKQFEGHSQEEVDKAIKKLDALSQGILSSYYLDAERLNQVQIAKKYGVTPSNVCRKIKYSIQTINKILNGEVVKIFEQGDRKSLLYKQFEGYSEKSVNKAILNLKSREREILTAYYLNEKDNLTQKQLAEKYHLSTAGISLTIKKSIQKIKDELLYGSSISENSIEELINEFYSQFDGYSRKEVDKALLQIDKRNADVLIFYYGLKGEKLSTKQIGERCEFTPNNINYYLTKAVNSLQNQLSLPSIILKRKEIYYSQFEGYSKEAIDNAMNNLNSKYRDVLKAYYLNDEACLSQKQIAEKYQLPTSTVSLIIKKSIQKIKEDLLFGTQKKLYLIERSNNFYSKFEGYTKEQVDEALSTLDLTSKKILEEYYFNSEEILTYKEIAQKNNLSESDVAYSIKKSINKIKEFFKNQIYLNEKKEEFYNLFDMFNKEDVDKALFLLDENFKEIISFSYGLNNQILSNKEISKKMNINLKDIDILLKESILKLKEILLKQHLLTNKTQLRDDINSDNNLRNLIELYGKELVQDSLKELSDVEKSFLLSYYRMTLRDCSDVESFFELEKIDDKTLSVIEGKIIDKLSSAIEVKKRQKEVEKKNKLFYERIVVEDKSLVKKALAKLGEMEIKLLVAVYGLNGKDVFSLEELSTKIGAEPEYIEKLLDRIIDKINKYLTNQGPLNPENR